MDSLYTPEVGHRSQTKGNLKIFNDAFRRDALGDDDHLLLDEVPQQNLSWCLGVSFGDVHNDRIFQQLADRFHPNQCAVLEVIDPDVVVPILPLPFLRVLFL